jgi:enamine deaminase RidA (YjgF/YER057c/UK114 family)
MFEAVMLTLQRMVVDKKGVTTLEELRKQKKLYFDTLVNILEKEGLKLEDVKDLEILKDLRNKLNMKVSNLPKKKLYGHIP